MIFREIVGRSGKFKKLTFSPNWKTWASWNSQQYLRISRTIWFIFYRTTSVRISLTFNKFSLQMSFLLLFIYSVFPGIVWHMEPLQSERIRNSNLQIVSRNIFKNYIWKYMRTPTFKFCLLRYVVLFWGRDPSLIGQTNHRILYWKSQIFQFTRYRRDHFLRVINCHTHPGSGVDS